MARGDFSTARSKLPARLISTRHPILRITTLSARCESLLSREPFALVHYRLCQTPPMRFPTQKPYRKTLERRGQESQEPRKLRDEIAVRRRSRKKKKKKKKRGKNEVCFLCALLFRYNWKDRAENKGHRLDEDCGGKGGEEGGGGGGEQEDDVEVEWLSGWTLPSFLER
ncbi:hypothetical protein ALC56_05797 [Trachymyrmex septentrionalis]|uniref:Uncharacterized protein n=1 Tax=Trachymyrmex septentrionalis TaxID=34720 RepID=A0A151JXS5_9HYME|nr:hypothetical protein ALC56_05797 [Trachymyrmex septentrionalis]